MFGLTLLHFDVAKLLHVNSHVLVKNVRWFYPLTVHKWVVTVSSSASSLCQHSWFTVRVGIGCSHLRVAATREEEVRWQLLEQCIWQGTRVVPFSAEVPRGDVWGSHIFGALCTAVEGLVDTSCPNMCQNSDTWGLSHFPFHEKNGCSTQKEGGLILARRRAVVAGEEECCS